MASEIYDLIWAFFHQGTEGGGDPMLFSIRIPDQEILRKMIYFD